MVSHGACQYHGLILQQVVVVVVVALSLAWRTNNGVTPAGRQNAYKKGDESKKQFQFFWVSADRMKRGL